MAVLKKVKRDGKRVTAILAGEGPDETLRVGASPWEDLDLREGDLLSPESEEKLRRFWNAILLSQTKKTHILADSPDVRGILIASKTADSGTKTLSFLMNGGLKFFSCIPRLLSYESYAGKIRSKHAGKDTWYIFTLAVEKASQGKHVATSLMSPLLSYLDRVGADCYLETHDKKNVPIYEHFGFALVETGTVPHSKLTHYAMLRKPKTSETNKR